MLTYIGTVLTCPQAGHKMVLFSLESRFRHSSYDLSTYHEKMVKFLNSHLKKEENKLQCHRSLVNVGHGVQMDVALKSSIHSSII